MQHTDFLNLNLPEDTDPVEVSDLSENFEAIDRSLSAGGGIPSGGIIIWSGAVDAVPPGWVVCDGTNGTPDLRDRFVLGGGGSRAVGSTGGAETHKLTTSETPSHSHRQLTGMGATGEPKPQSYLINNGTTTDGGTGYMGSGSAYHAAGKSPSSVYTQSSGSGAAHSIMPPYYVLCYIMKV